MKKILALMIALVMMLGCVPALAENEVEYKNIKINVNGEKIILLDAEDVQQKSIAANGKVYVPIEELILALGGEYSYSVDQNQINIVLSASPSVESSTEDTDPEAFSVIGKWLCNDSHGSYMIFNEDGTGEAGGASVNVAKLAFHWQVIDDVLKFEYKYHGAKNSATYNIVSQNGEYVLIYANDANRVFSRADASGISRDIVGTWACVLSDDTATLVIGKDGNAKLMVGRNTYHCMCKQDGNILILSQNGSNITAIYENNTISMTFAGVKMVFKR